MKIAILTGEPSGDLLAHDVVKVMRDQYPEAALIGIGGERLETLGLRSRFPLSEFSVNGIVEVLPHLPRLLFRIEQITRWLLKEQPDLVLTVDAPDLTLRIAKMLRARGYGGKLVHLVAPTVWAWKPERAEKVSAFLDHILCLFPFEPPYFETHGLAATFIGHPIVSRPVSPVIKDDNALLLLPGSRMNEVWQLVPLFREVAAQAEAELLAIVDMGKRERRTVAYNENQLYQQQIAAMGVAPKERKKRKELRLPRFLRLPKLEEWQMFDRDALNALQDKEEIAFKALPEEIQLQASGKAVEKTEEESAKDDSEKKEGEEKKDESVEESVN